MFPYKIQDTALQKAIKDGFSLGPVHETIDDLRHVIIKSEELVRVKTAKVLFANYNLLAHDFPQLGKATLEDRKGEGITDDQLQAYINQWLIANVAYVSKAQAAQSVVNSEIVTEDLKVKGYRPPTYGRAAIYSVQENYALLKGKEGLCLEPEDKGVLDVKGAGISPGVKPSFRSHGDGLLTLQDAFIEYLNQLMIQGVFIQEDTNFKTLPIYAIIDLGFDVKNADGGITGPACLLVRRAHTRPENPGGLPKYGSDQQLVQVEVERLLRQYGLTSCNYITGISVWKEAGELKVAYGRNNVNHLTQEQLDNIERVSHFTGARIDFDGINIQHTGEYAHDPSDCTLVDFGSYRVWPKFRNPLLSLVSDRLLRWGGSVFPEMEEYVQPHPDKQISLTDWGKKGDLFGFETMFRDARQDIICEGLAKAYRAEMYNEADTVEMLDAYLQSAILPWKERILQFDEDRKTIDATT